MKNNRKKQTSSYLLIFLGIVAALLILIILYLTFFRKDSQSSINLAKNDSATDQTEDFTDGETFGFTSGDETSDDADQSGFVSDDGSSDSESSTDDSSVQGPSQRESAGPVQSSPTPEEVTVPYQTPAANAEPIGSSQSSGSDSAQTTDGTSQAGNQTVCRVIITDGDHWCQIGIQGGRTILLGQRIIILIYCTHNEKLDQAGCLHWGIIDRSL